MLVSDSLFPHHPILNAKFPPITALLNRSTYHKMPKAPLHPFPKSDGNPKSMNKLALNETAITGNNMIFAIFYSERIYIPGYSSQHQRHPSRLRACQDSHLLLKYFPLDFLCSGLLLARQAPAHRQQSSGFKSHLSFV